MNYALIAEVAKSMLLARFKQTLVAAIGVTFGITMFITLLSFMSGLNDLLDGLIINRTHILDCITRSNLPPNNRLICLKIQRVLQFCQLGQT